MSIRDEIHREIVLKEYICLVCQGNIGPKSSIWTCTGCFRCFDLGCIRKWGEKELRTKKDWRCPICFKTYNKNPANLRYKCWCGKSTTRGGNLPHSCGQTCGAKRSCPHPCPLTCHAGPHLEVKDCMFMGPEVKCYCGKHSTQTTCSLTPYGGYSCEEKCLTKFANCEHKCQKVCHEKPGAGCGACKKQITVSCYCGKLQKRKVKCSSLSKEDRKALKSHKKIRCKKVCGSLYDCGIHTCDQKCHEHKSDSPCKLTPDPKERCFCGKNLTNRKKCTDELLPCGQMCGKIMACGHECKSPCHSGKCPNCPVILTAQCNCGSETRETSCFKLQTVGVECENLCPQFLTCKQHKCRKKCCKFAKRKPVNPSLHKSIQSAKRGVTFNLAELRVTDLSTINTRRVEEPQLSEEEEAAHMCLRECGKMLDCGKHFCTKMCHPGKCEPCKHVVYEEYVCPCKRTIMDPPYPCQTPPPFCEFPCPKLQECGHRGQHLCHDLNEECPPCTMLVRKPCQCGKSSSMVRCSASKLEIKGIKCMELCLKPLECGHICQRTCCTDCQPCTAPCPTIYECGHSHNSTCHFPEPCDYNCQTVLTATCPCGVLKCDYECGEDLQIYCNEKCLKEYYPPVVIDSYKKSPQITLAIEDKVRNFAQNRGTPSLTFKPMPAEVRRIVYFLLEHYGMHGEGVDYGENRSVRATKTFGTWVPTKTLKESTFKRPQVFVNGFLVKKDPNTNGWTVDLNEPQLNPIKEGNKEVPEPEQEPQANQLSETRQTEPSTLDSDPSEN